MKLLKRALGNNDFNFKRYGKPSKNFNWYGVGRGLNAALCAQALQKAQK